MEVWKDIPGYEGKYQISTAGRVLSLNYEGVEGNKQFLKSNITAKGYYRIRLYKNNKVWSVLLHDLMAQVFLSNPENLPIVNHKDENPANNNLYNLEWCTHKYNSNYGTRNERLSKTHLERNHFGKAIRCIETGIEYVSAQEAGRQLNIGGLSRSISLCCNGKRQTCAGYHWEWV